jgi:hypothetical protein
MLESLLADAQHSDVRITVYRRGEAESVEGWFDSHGPDLERRSLPDGGPESFVVVERDGAFAGALGTAELSWLLEPPIVRPGDRNGVSEGYRALFDALDDTVFTAMTRRELLAVSREIEDRAYRVGTGVLRVGFQTAAAFDAQLDAYRALATETALEIHVYGVDPSERPQPGIEGITCHGGSDAIDRYWALAFDGGGDDGRACGLLAQERSAGYDGFWTDDAAIVERIAAGLADG